MDSLETPDYDIQRDKYGANGESSVKIEWPVEVVRRVENNTTVTGENATYGGNYADLVSEAKYRLSKRLGNSLVNLEAYLIDDPPVVTDAPTRWNIEGGRQRWNEKEPGHTVANRLGFPEMSFELYSSELAEAAKQRAAEDSTHHVRVLAEWAHLAFPDGDDDRFNRSGLSPLTTALIKEARTHSSVDWALAFDGSPVGRRGDHEHPPVGYFDPVEHGYDDIEHEPYAFEEELYDYSKGGFEYVLDRRKGE